MDLTVTWRKTSGEETLAMPGFPFGLAGMGDGTEKVPEFIRLAPPRKTIYAVPASITPVPSDRD